MMRGEFDAAQWRFLAGNEVEGRLGIDAATG